MTAPVRVHGRRGGLAWLPGHAAPPAAGAPAPAPGAAPPAASPDGEGRGIWGVRAVWQSLSTGVDWTLPFVGFLIYLATIVTNRFTVGQPAVILALVGLFGQRRPFRLGPLSLLFAAYAVWAGLTVLVSPYRPSLTDPITDLFKLLVVLVVGINAVRTLAQWRFTVVWILFWFALYPGRGSYLNYITGANVVFGRVIWNGVYANPNDLGLIAMLMLSLGAALAVQEPPGLVRTAARVSVPLFAVLVSFTQSRGVLLALIGYGAGAILLGTRGAAVVRGVRRRGRWRAVLAGVAAVAVVGFFAPDAMWERMRGLVEQSDETNREAIDNDSSAQQRLAIWRVARSIAADNPLTGVGLGGYPYANEVTASLPDFDPLAGGRRDTHSTYLNVLCEVGVPGFLIFMALVGYTIAFAGRVRKAAQAVDPATARTLLLLELGVVAYLMAAVWGSYARLNMTYLTLLLVWVRTQIAQEALAGAAPGGAAGPRGRLAPAAAALPA